MVFEQQGTERERLGRCPIDAFAGLDRLAAVVDETLQGPVQVETLRYRRDLRPDLFERRERDAGMAAARVIGIARRFDVGPAAVEPVGAVCLVALARFERGIELDARLDPQRHGSARRYRRYVRGPMAGDRGWSRMIG